MAGGGGPIGPRLLIVWHSRTGTARALAQCAADGAALHGAAVEMLPARCATVADLLRADGLIFAGPENLGTLSGEMKDMVDRCYYPLGDQLAGRPHGIIIAAGTDGDGAARLWARIGAGWRLRAVADPIIARTGADSP
ncbi:MAG: flavodoxin family protein, partial [Sphingopyxis sp.]